MLLSSSGWTSWNVGKISPYQVKLSRMRTFHHFMSTRATEKSLHSYCWWYWYNIVCHLVDKCRHRVASWSCWRGPSNLIVTACTLEIRKQRVTHSQSECMCPEMNVTFFCCILNGTTHTHVKRILQNRMFSFFTLIVLCALCPRMYFLLPLTH